MKMVERTIGTKSGTGGSAGAEYLRAHALPAALPRPLGDPRRAVSARARLTLAPHARTRSRRTTPASASASGCCSPATPTRPGPTSRSTGMIEAFDDAARAVDEKWERAFAQAERVRDGFRAAARRAGRRDRARREHPRAASCACSRRCRWRRSRAWIVTTDGEFHTLRRQLARLDRGGDRGRARAVRASRDTLAERLAAAIDDRTLAVLVSAVFFETARIVPGLVELAAACDAPRRPARSSTPTTPSASCRSRSTSRGSTSAFVIGGGYKYLQLGEGNCLPAVAAGARPAAVVTGWFAEFEALEATGELGRVAYRSEAPRALAGATYDPTSHYRAARVFDFFAEQGLDAELLREVSQHQVGRLAERFDALEPARRLVRRDRATPLARIGGFLALRSPRAGELQRALAARGVSTDQRGEILRLGPAPYLSDAQLDAAGAALGEAARALA